MFASDEVTALITTILNSIQHIIALLPEIVLVEYVEQKQCGGIRVASRDTGAMFLIYCRDALQGMYFKSKLTVSVIFK